MPESGITSATPTDQATLDEDDPTVGSGPDIYPDETLVLVGCGGQQRDPENDVDVHQAVVGPDEQVHGVLEDGPAWEARDLYTRRDFPVKREFAEAVTSWKPGEDSYSCGWAILSAEHGVVEPGKPVTPYETTIEDIGADPTNEDHWHTGVTLGNGRRPDGREVVTEMDYWAQKVAIDLERWVSGHHDNLRNDPREKQFTLLVLAAQAYVEPLRERGVFEYGSSRTLGDPNDTRFSVPVVPRYLYEEIGADTIDDQIAWLSDAISRFADGDDEPTEQTTLSAAAQGGEAGAR